MQRARLLLLLLPLVLCAAVVLVNAESASLLRVNVDMDVSEADEMLRVRRRREAVLAEFQRTEVLDDGTVRITPIDDSERVPLWERATVASESDTLGKDPSPYWSWVPQFKAAAVVSATVSWSAPCFAQNNATLTVTDDGWKLVHVAAHPRTLTCDDLYLLATPEHAHVHNVFTHGEKHVSGGSWKDGEKAWVLQSGLQIFNFPDGILGTVVDAWDTFRLFTGRNMPKDNVAFLREKAGLVFNPRSQGMLNIPFDEFQSGDYLGITRLDGLDPVIMWNAGGVFGHTAMVLVIDGVKYVCESTDLDPFGKAYWPPPYGIIRTPIAQWFKQAQQAQYMVVWARLKPEIRARWNNDAAVAFFKKSEGLDYGLHNFAYGWIDTEQYNFAPPLTPQIMTVGVAIADRLIPANVTIVILEGINQRLRYYKKSSLQCQTVQCVLDYCDQQNIGIFELMTLPERDDWLYSDGPNMVCDVFVARTYIAAGVFEPGVDIQATEMTPKDVYNLDIFDKNWAPPAPCVPNMPFCQLAGDYWVPLALDQFSFVKPYSNMDFSCHTEPTAYERIPAGC